jgi:hypothetical protein
MDITLKKIWVVRDPSPISELIDIVFETTLQKLPQYVLGTGPSWYSETPRFYDNERDALKDAEARLASRPKKADYDRR